MPEELGRTDEPFVSLTGANSEPAAAVRDVISSSLACARDTVSSLPRALSKGPLSHPAASVREPLSYLAPTTAVVVVGYPQASPRVDIECPCEATTAAAFCLSLVRRRECNYLG